MASTGHQHVHRHMRNTVKMSIQVNVSRRDSIRLIMAPIIAPLLCCACSPALSAVSDIELISTLAPVLNLRDSLNTLSSDIENGTNADLRRIVRTLQKGINLNKAVRLSSQRLPSAQAEAIRTHGREAAEFINQVVDYYDPTSLRDRPPADALNFSLMAIQKARDELDLIIEAFSPSIVEEARRVNGEWPYVYNVRYHTAEQLTFSLLVLNILKKIGVYFKKYCTII